ncbi:MAG TPA: mechanosensitive ion channel domain-containing protein [Gammaproteobacteria bacterium]|jgi:small-conductance mechanosensitive channel|nr:mechanosensitive ion channel domain-containing protein [Gammaproteobacteria bacterium]
MSGLTDDLLSAALFAVLLCASLGVTYLVLWLLRPVARRIPGGIAECVLKRLREPVLVLVPLLVMLAAQPLARFSPRVDNSVYHAVTMLLIAATGWGCVRLFDAWRDSLTLRHRLDVADNLRARQVITQVLIIRRIAVVLVVIITLAAMLMTFPQVRALGTTLFASAGAAGLLIGLAAKPTATNILAGLQVALTEPIRIDDVVVVEGEWGWIEEIRTTYVVVRVWDQRRLLLPLSYFIEKPFQNWTRRTADLLATVTLYVDYVTPVVEVRERLHEILKSSRLWDGKAWALQVTDATSHTLELRALMSVANSGSAWDLRCLVREELVRYLQERRPDCLPHTRIALSKAPEAQGDTDLGVS